MLGICNGFQVLTEAGLLPGALMRNAELKFVCRPVDAGGRGNPDRLHRANIEWASACVFPSPMAKATISPTTRRSTGWKARAACVFRYAAGDNPNGSARNIAGILNEKRNVLGLMPHPERVVDPLLGCTDGRALFQSLIETLS